MGVCVGGGGVGWGEGVNTYSMALFHMVTSDEISTLSGTGVVRLVMCTGTKVVRKQRIY